MNLSSSSFAGSSNHPIETDDMKYYSTNRQAPAVSLGEAVVAPADNGGVVTLAFPLPEGEDTVLFGARVTAPTTP